MHFEWRLSSKQNRRSLVCLRSPPIYQVPFLLFASPCFLEKVGAVLCMFIPPPELHREDE
jgi:hypothetical protein